MLKLEGKGLASEFHCSGLGTKGQYWWIPKHAADDRYHKVKKHAARISNECIAPFINEYSNSIANAMQEHGVWGAILNSTYSPKT